MRTRPAANRRDPRRRGHGDRMGGGRGEPTVDQGDADARRRPARPTGAGGGARPRAAGHGHADSGPAGRRLAGMAQPDRLERVTDLLLVLLDTSRPLSLREIADRVPGYPDGPRRPTPGLRAGQAAPAGRGGAGPGRVRSTAEEQVGYRVDPDAYYLPDLGLEPDEQAALNLAVAGVHLGEPIGREALSKLGMGGSWPRRGAPLPLVDLPLVDGLPALPAAVRRRARPAAAVDFSYRGAPRSVDVAGIRFRGGHWYVVGLGPRPGRGPHLPGRPHRRAARARRRRDRPSCPTGSTPTGSSPATPGTSGPGEAVEVDVAVDAAEASRVVTELGPDAVVERDRRRRSGRPPGGDRRRGPRVLGPRPARPRRGAAARRGPCRRGGPARVRSSARPGVAR